MRRFFKSMLTIYRIIRRYEVLSFSITFVNIFYYLFMYIFKEKLVNCTQLISDLMYIYQRILMIYLFLTLIN